MAKITEVYEHYKIMPALQLHQLRVATVAKQICDNLDQPIDKEAVITACLLHDMANIIKFDLSQFPQYLGPKGLAYWEAVKQKYIEKYGPDEHLASIQIAKKLGVSQLVVDCIASIDFSRAIQTANGSRWEPKVCDYADLRVGPHGVLSLEGRLEEGRKRYAKRKDKWMSDEQRKAITEACFQNEEQIFSHTQIKPADITDQSVLPLIKELKSYEI